MEPAEWAFAYGGAAMSHAFGKYVSNPETWNKSPKAPWKYKMAPLTRSFPRKNTVRGAIMAGRKHTRTPTRDRGRSASRQRTIRRMDPDTPMSGSRGRSRVRSVSMAASNRRSRSRSQSLYGVRRVGGRRRVVRIGRTGGGRPNRYYSRRQLRSRNFNPVKDGAEVVFEVSGNINTESPNAVYIGHGCATTVFWQNVCRAIVRKLARGAGIEVLDWGQSVDGATSATNLKLQIQYSIANVTSVWVFDTTDIIIPVLPTLFTWNDLGLQLAARLDAIITPANTNVTIGCILIYQNDAQTLPLMKLDCSHMKVKYRITSKLKLQNVTLAANAADIEDEDAANVARNPLVGKLYSSKYRANGYKVETAPINGVGTAWSTAVPTVVDQSSGLLAWKVQNSSSADFKAKFKKPPSGHMFCLKGKPYGMEPGQISTIQFSDFRIINFNTLLSIYQKSIGDLTSSVYQNIGRFQMVGLEKKMHCALSEGTVSVDYAIEQFHSCVVTSFKGSVPKLQSITDP